MNEIVGCEEGEEVGERDGAVIRISLGALEELSDGRELGLSVGG